MSGPPRAASEAHLAFCHDALQDVSRTFALTVQALEEPLASRICLGYLLCRIPDTIEDAGHIPPTEQARLLRRYGRAIDPDAADTTGEFATDVESWQPSGSARDDDWRVVADADRVTTTFETLPAGVRDTILPPILELVEGLATFVERHADTEGLRIESREELEEYCHYAAGTVGTLITDLLTGPELDGDRRRTMEGNAEAFGLLLQLVNIAKDVHADYSEENNVYLPAAWLAQEDVPQESVLEAEYRDGAAAVVARTAAHAESFLDDAEAYLKAMPLTDGNTLPAWGVPFLLAVGTLRELRAAPAAALTAADVKVSRPEVYAIREAMADADRGRIGELRSIVSREPLHEASVPISSD